MNSHDAIVEIPLEDLTRDPVLPPRIVDEGRLETLCRSMTERGMAEPIVVRRVPDKTGIGPRYFIVLGYRRYLGAGRLGWAAVPAVRRGDLDDKGVLHLAFDADKTTESRTCLEDAWYYASMCVAGMTQASLAKREGFSEGKASMYVRTGNAITPERIAEAGMAPEDLAQFRITKLSAIASGPEAEVATRIAAAVKPPSMEERRAPLFEWEEGRNGVTRAIFRTADVASWSHEERLQTIERLGPLVAVARRIEGIEDPAFVARRSMLEQRHREILLEAREAQSDQIVRLMDMNTQLLLAFNVNGKLGISAIPQPETRVGQLARAVNSAFRRLTGWVRGASTVEGSPSTVEPAARFPDAQITLDLEQDEAA